MLRDALALHRDCQASELPEDYQVSQLAHLEEMVRGVWQHSAWPHFDPAPFRHAHGGAMIDIARCGQPGDKTVVTKQPNPNGLDLARQFLPAPRVRIVAIVRDPRAVADSGRATFGKPVGDYARRWARGAAWIERHRAELDAVVRFEDLAVGVKAYDALLQACHLNPKGMDWMSLACLPVRGSSDLVRDQPSAAMHWRPMPRPPGFDPVGRWKVTLGREAIELVENTVGGQLMQAFGYEPRTL